jgi:hypothetical protein
MTGQDAGQWYIARDGKQTGPISDVEIKAVAAHGHFRPTDLVWRNGMPEWQPAFNVFPPISAVAPPAPPRQPIVASRDAELRHESVDAPATAAAPSGGLVAQYRVQSPANTVPAPVETTGRVMPAEPADARGVRAQPFTMPTDEPTAPSGGRRRNSDPPTLELQRLMSVDCQRRPLIAPNLCAQSQRSVPRLRASWSARSIRATATASRRLSQSATALRLPQVR